MLRKILLPTIFALLAYGFWASADFKEIAAGVAIFLFGMLALEQGFRAFSGGLLERVLKRSTDATFKSLGFGVVTTTLMQSSSLVSVITISFLSAGMIGLESGLGIIFGANLGTTTGAWLVAGFGLKVKISAYAMPMLVFGIICVFQKSKSLKGIGYILAGLGFLFLGIHYMKEGFEAFKGTIDLAEFAVPGFAGLLLFTAVGIAATVILQSSHATLVLIITALAAGQITYENALALAIGANIGTTITAILGAMGANVEGKRLAGGHLIFNLVTGLIAIAAIGPFTLAVGRISDAVGIAADDYTLRLSVFHTLFNTVGVVVMLPFLGLLVRLLKRLLPDTSFPETEPKYLNDAAADFFDTAIEAVRLETEHLYDSAFEILAHGIDLHRTEICSGDDFGKIIEGRKKPIEIDIDAKYENTVKVLYGAIVEFVTKAQAKLPSREAERLVLFRNAVRDIVEAVKHVKHLRKNLAVYIVSDNPEIRGAYNLIRVMLGRLMRDLAEVRREALSGDLALSADLDSLRVEARQADFLQNGKLDHLIRDGLIDANMATSLINDSSYAQYAAKHLIAMARDLWGQRDTEHRDAEAELLLSEEELQQFAQLLDTDEPPRSNP